MLGYILAILVFCLFIAFILRIAENCNTPTWKGIIISALLGCLPLYLFLCFIGWMGESKS